MIEWTVGARIGAAIRKYRSAPPQDDPVEAGHHASPRPHIRRAHWHSFWTGSKTGERSLIVKWIPPVPVMVVGETPVVIYPVKQ